MIKAGQLNGFVDHIRNSFLALPFDEGKLGNEYVTGVSEKLLFSHGELLHPVHSGEIADDLCDHADVTGLHFVEIFAVSAIPVRIHFRGFARKHFINPVYEAAVDN